MIAISIPRVCSLKEAYIWFLENHSGNVICVKKDKEKEVSCYPQAIKFYRKTRKR